MLLYKYIILCTLVGRCSIDATASDTKCKSKKWQNLAPLPNTRQEHGPVVVNDTIIAVTGGILDNITTGDVHFFYNPSNTWYKFAPVPPIESITRMLQL